ncbi:MAG TPA: hypothetical protein VGB17_03415 [Pyrinomonadaceae bacterium]
MDIADIFRFLGSVIPLITSILQFFTELRKRAKWTRETQAELSKFGWTYWVIDVFPNIILKLLLGVIILASLTSIVEGAYKVSNQASLSKLSDFLFRNSLWIAAIWFIIAVIIYFNIVPMLLLRLTALYPGMSYKPGWINAKWHIESDESAKPINVSEQGYKAVANDMVKALEKAETFSGDRAIRPEGITDEETANLFLFGCIIEGKIYDLNFRLNWNSFYDALGQAALTAERPFSPEGIKKFSSEKTSLYRRLIDLCKPYELPDEPSIDSTVKDAVDYLSDAHDGSARNIAFSYWHKNSPWIKTAVRRAKKIPRLDGLEHESMRTQFLKLAVGSGVWEGIDPGPFVFPFSNRIAEMFFNKRCLITLSNVKSIPLVKEVKHLVAYTEKLIVDEVQNTLNNLPDAKISEACQSLFNCKPGEVPMWKLSYEVDYLLWYLAGHPEISEEILVQRGVADTSWKLEGNSIARE